MPMVAIMLIVLLGIVSVLLVMVLGYFLVVPLSELRRRSKRGDEVSRLRYEVARNPVMVKALLGSFAVISLIFFTVLVSQKLSVLWAAVTIASALVVLRVFYVRSEVMRKVALFLAPYIIRIFLILKPVARLLRWPVSFLFFRQVKTADAYRRSDVVQYLESQKLSAQSPTKYAELDRAIHALKISDIKVADFMTGLRDVRFVASDEPVSPILMDELHATGWVEFPVYVDKKQNVVGRLRLSDLVERKLSGQVFTAMQPEVQYATVDETALSLLEGYVEHRHNIVMVRGENGKIVGIVDPGVVVRSLLL